MAHYATGKSGGMNKRKTNKSLKARTSNKTSKAYHTEPYKLGMKGGMKMKKSHNDGGAY